jgi:hypothetical protein
MVDTIEDEKEEIILIFKCIDTRLEEWEEEKIEECKAKGCKVLLLSDAGANVRDREASLKLVGKKYKVVEAHLAAHDDCAAVGVMCAKIGHTIGEHSKYLDPLLDQTIGMKKFGDAENHTVQKAAIESMFPGVRIIDDYVYFDNMSKHPASEKHFEVVVVGECYKEDRELADELGLDLHITYFVRTLKPEEALIDMALLLDKKGIREAIVYNAEENSKQFNAACKLYAKSFPEINVITDMAFKKQRSPHSEDTAHTPQKQKSKR